LRCETCCPCYKTDRGFTWGEECSGRLGHGVGTNVLQPRLVESLSICKVELIACGEIHTCAVTATGDLYTWGDGTHNAGLLGHGSNVSHWIPKRVSGSLDGLQVSTVSCGTWHTTLITSSGKLYTFGDGTFGVLGHGNRESCSYPKEVKSLKGLRTISISCGVWHTAAVVEVIISQSNALSGKLFTWGDGDKYRLGHGDRSSKLKPTCVPSLIDYNFHSRAACGHTLTIGLTASGHIFTVGSSVHGQLGNPNNDEGILAWLKKNLGVAVLWRLLVDRIMLQY
jgi:alpha-tubulin suppressor-like RCC1 family protein